MAYSTMPTGDMRAEIAVASVHKYVEQFKAALQKYPQARAYQKIRVAYITARTIRITLEGDAQEARFREGVLKAQLDRQEELLPAEARKALL